MSAFRILVDARATQEGFRQHRQRGLGHYAENLLRRLPSALPPGLGLECLVESALPLDAALLPSGAPVRRVERPPGAGRPGRFLHDQRRVPPALRASGCGLAHFLYHLDCPLWAPLPTLVTVPDLIPHVMPWLYPPAQRLKFAARRRIETSICRRAVGIIAMSEAGRQDIIRVMRVPPQKVRVVHLGVQPRFFAPPGTEAVARLRSSYGLPDRFILYLGGIDPRKNVGALVHAWADLCEDPALRVPLVLAGRLDNQREFPALLAGIRARGLEDRVLLPGYVPEEELPTLFSAATLFAFPSLYEGFGLPVLQAMAAGCPVLTVRRSSLPEVAGDAAFYVEEGTREELARGLRDVLKDPVGAARVAARARDRARAFTWERTARETAEIYAGASAELQGPPP
jgi:glycosyltransferase involved in cell wall biosynthesis